MSGTTIGVIKGDTRSLDYSSFGAGRVQGFDRVRAPQHSSHSV